jgi:hypothetical protein
MWSADLATIPDDRLGYRTTLRDQLKAFGIGIVDPDRVPTTLEYNVNRRQLQLSPEEVHRFLWTNADQLKIRTDFGLWVERVTPVTRIGLDGFVVDEVIADYVQRGETTIGQLPPGARPAGSDPATEVRIGGGGVIVFDQAGKVRYHAQHRIDDWAAQRARLAQLPRVGRNQRLGFSLGDQAGLQFAALHAGSSSEAW